MPSTSKERQEASSPPEGPPVLPDGQAPYFIARMALQIIRDSRHEYSGHLEAAFALQSLEVADNNGTLQPPLTADLFASVWDARVAYIEEQSRMKAQEDPSYPSYNEVMAYNHDVAETVLEAVVKHGLHPKLQA